LEHKPELVLRVVSRHYELHPELTQRYGHSGRVKCAEDAAYHINYLAEALSLGKPELFADYVAWAKVMLSTRGIATQDLADNLRILWEVVTGWLPTTEAQGIIARFVGAALDRIPQYPADAPTLIRDDEPHSQLAKRYLQALLEGQRELASRLILDAARTGTPIRELYLFVFERSQQEIGRLWQVNQITVAHEHYCTAATQMIITQLYPYIFSGEKTGRHVMTACAVGELHEMGPRMVCDFLEMEGWNTTYLGANVPVPALLRILEERRPDLLALSATMAYHLQVVRKAISDVRRKFTGEQLRIVVGGYAFRNSPELWSEVGADGFASNALEMISLVNRLVPEGL
jgi:MerR family transcriptional regulator, light-induced transcriptional regulator